MSNIYFTSDLHLGHRTAAVLRGFDSVAEHDAQVVYSLMQPLEKRDLLWVLGDIAWSPQHLAPLGAIPCPMKAVLGNHDTMDTQVYLKRFEWVGGAVRYKNLWLTHIPIHPQEIYRCAANVHGHIHKNAATPPLELPYINVNWDFWQRPVSLNEIREMLP